MLYSQHAPINVLDPDLRLSSHLQHWSRLGDGDAVGSGNVIDYSGRGNDGTFINGESGDFVSDVPP